MKSGEGMMAALAGGTLWLIYLAITLPQSAIEGRIDEGRIADLMMPRASVVVLCVIAFIGIARTFTHSFRAGFARPLALALAVYCGCIAMLCFERAAMTTRKVVRLEGPYSGCRVLLKTEPRDWKVWHAEHGIGYVESIPIPAKSRVTGHVDVLEIAKDAADDPSLTLPDCKSGGSIS